MLSDFQLAVLCAHTYSSPCIAVGHEKGVLHFQVTENEGIWYVAVQGTQSRLQAITDAHVWPQRSTHGWWAHSGFLAAAEALVQVLPHYVPLHCELVLTGHSLGAAVATCAAALLKSEGLSAWAHVVRVVGFGSPRVGMAGMRKALRDSADIVLYRNGDDVVPCLPFAFPLPYRHACELTMIGERTFGFLDDDCVEEHAIANYITALNDECQP